MSMKEQNMQYDPAEMLGEVSQVSAPPFLLTRIRQRITNTQQRVSAKWAIATALSMAAIFVINIYLVTWAPAEQQQREGIELATAMNLLPQNALYR